jgi:hypothetical protein
VVSLLGAVHAAIPPPASFYSRVIFLTDLDIYKTTHRLIDTTADYSLIVTTGILFGVGVVLFLLPPVPGVPIYLTMGIVIPAIARDTFGKYN